MDVRIQDSTAPLEERLAAQAAIYGDMMDVCLDSDNCTAFCTWGFTDRYTWIPWFTGNPDWPLPFDEDYQPKPAYYALFDALGGPAAVGGVAESPGRSDEGQNAWASIAAVGAAGIIALGGAAWYARRRWLR
jgi:hypothetical protein